MQRLHNHRFPSDTDTPPCLSPPHSHTQMSPGFSYWQKHLFFLVLQSVLFHFLSVFLSPVVYHLLKFQGLHLSLTNLCGLSFQAGNIRMIRIVNYNKKFHFRTDLPLLYLPPDTFLFPVYCFLHNSLSFYYTSL